MRTLSSHSHSHSHGDGHMHAHSHGAPARAGPAETDAAVHERLDKFVKNNDVAVLMKGVPDQPMCGFSRNVVMVLRAQGVPHISHINILEDEAVRRYAKEYSSWPTFPQVYVKGEFIGGCDIIVDMFKRGELETLLKEKGIELKETE